MTARGSPSTILRPKLSTTSRDTTASSACTTCSTHTMVMPASLDGAHELHQLDAFGLGQPAGDLVEQQEPRRAGKRAGQFEPLAAEQVERAGTAIGESDEAGALQDFAAGVGDLGLALPAAVDRGDQQVLEHGEVLERVRNLERAADAGDAARARRRLRDVAAVEPNGAAVRPDEPGDQVEQRRFAGAVRADDAERFACCATSRLTPSTALSEPNDRVRLSSLRITPPSLPSEHDSERWKPVSRRHHAPPEKARAQSFRLEAIALQKAPPRADADPPVSAR